jgi:uroporphyrinogen-III synthase
VIVTRPESEAKKWTCSLREAGYDALSLPLICVTGASDTSAVSAAWAHMDDYHAAMFVSGNAIEHFFALKPPETFVFNAQAAIKTRAYVTGPGSVAALLRAQAQRDWIDAPDPDCGQFDSEALWSVVKAQITPGCRVLIVRGSGSTGADDGAGAGRDWFSKQVQLAGGVVDFVVAYQRRAPLLGALEQALVSEAAVDGSIWLFSSSEAIANLVSVVPGQDWSQARAVATHPRIALAAKNAGFSVVCESRPTLPAVTASIESMQ